MTKILALFTCYNRKEKTVQCIESIVNNNQNCQISFVVVDDNSSDDTVQALKEMSENYSIEILMGTGSLFYSGGMRKAMEHVTQSNFSNYDYVLLMNDDVLFFERCIEKLVEQSCEQNNAIIVGATCDPNNNLTYSAVKYLKGINYSKMSCSDWTVKADTFNANCVLIPYKVFKEMPVMDGNYTHSLGDFDYGLSFSKKGYDIFVSKEYVGICENNTTKGTWTDNTLSIKERIIKKEQVKGAPFKSWFYFLKKNFGLKRAVVSSITPYIRILLKK